LSSTSSSVLSNETESPPSSTELAIEGDGGGLERNERRRPPILQPPLFYLRNQSEVRLPFVFWTVTCALASGLGRNIEIETVVCIAIGCSRSRLYKLLNCPQESSGPLVAYSLKVLWIKRRGNFVP
jgi:hypothetical protein